MSYEVIIKRSENNIFADFQKAVARIEKINTDNGNLRIEIGYYADVEAREIVKNNIVANNQPMPMNNYFIKQSNHNILMSEINELDFDKTDMTVEDVLKTACYKKLKELPEFENSIDIL